MKKRSLRFACRGDMHNLILTLLIAVNRILKMGFNVQRCNKMHGFHLKRARLAFDKSSPALEVNYRKKMKVATYEDSFCDLVLESEHCKLSASLIIESCM